MGLSEEGVGGHKSKSEKRIRVEGFRKGSRGRGLVLEKGSCAVLSWSPHEKRGVSDCPSQKDQY